jgi:hypothetical protein
MRIGPHGAWRLLKTAEQTKSIITTMNVVAKMSISAQYQPSENEIGGSHELIWLRL